MRWLSWVSGTLAGYSLFYAWSYVSLGIGGAYRLRMLFIPRDYEEAFDFIYS